MARVLLLCDTYAPHFGGSEAVLLEFARGAAAAGHRVCVITPAARVDAGEQRAFDQGEPYPIVRSRVWAALFRLGGSRSAWVSRAARALIVPWAALLLAARGRADVVVAGHAVPAGNAALLVASRRGTPVVLMTYGEEVTMYARGGRMRAWLAAALRGADVVTCLTEESASEIAALEPRLRRPPVVCPPPADERIAAMPAEAGDAVRRAHGLEARRVLLTVARLVPRKGVDVTIRALALLAEDHPELAYLVVGEGPQRAELEALARECGVADRVAFTGRVPDVAPFHHAADIFVMPNRQMDDGEREGYGIVFADAGLAGKPVVAGRSGGATDAVVDGGTGLLVDPTDPEAVAAAIRRLLADPALAARLGAAGRERAMRVCGSAAVRARFDAVLRMVLPGDTGRGDGNRAG